jgi:hypothetical protein
VGTKLEIDDAVHEMRIVVISGAHIESCWSPLVICRPFIRRSAWFGRLPLRLRITQQ